MYSDVPDHPVIVNMERTGYPDGKEPEYPHCPICGAECDTIYQNKEHDPVGCDECVTSCNAWDVEECFPQNERSY